MKNIIVLTLLVSFSAFSAEKVQVGENANPEFAGCLKEDKCPTQMCPNSCAMMAQQQHRNELRSATSTRKTKASAKGE